MDRFWDVYEPQDSAIGLFESDEDWARRITASPRPAYTTYGRTPKPARLPDPNFDLDRMLWRPRPKFPDFDIVTESVSTGGMVKTRAEAEVLAAAGITHVVNGATELYDEDRVFEGLGIEYLYNPTGDDNTWKDPQWFAAALAFTRPALAQGGHVYLHCLEGINRGPSLAYAVLRDQGMSIHEAHEAISKARPRAKMAYALDAEAAREGRP